ncbi:MAG: FliA/WhiG family RNA polymerase sigma factor [Verrucomicrobia bacterium]|nr:FliA/WhiG family RNA polymerase sigma factor [Verrucomicrobiota bacterium]
MKGASSFSGLTPMPTARTLEDGDKTRRARANMKGAILDRPFLPSLPSLPPVVKNPPPTITGKPMTNETSTPEQQALIVSMLPLVKTIVGRIAMTLPSHVSHEDLLSAGVVGLMDAVRRYDPTKGSSLKTYVAMRVRGAVLDELRKMDWVPRSVHRQARDFRKVQESLEQRLGREATEDELAHEMNISVEELERILENIQPASFVSLQDVRSYKDSEEGGLLQEECIADPRGVTSLEASLDVERRRLIFEGILMLNPVEQKVLALYYYEGLRLKEIAEALGVTESRVSQIHTLAIQRLRSRIERGEQIKD